MTPALAYTETPGSVRSHDQQAPGAIASPDPALPSHIVPAAGILALIASRQRRWGFSAEDMLAYLGTDCAIPDGRGVFSGRQAERILRRLLSPAKGTPRSARTARLQACAEAHQHVPGVPTVRERIRIAGELAGRKPSPAPAGAAL